MPLYTAQSGDLNRCYLCLTDSQTLKDSATQLLINYKSGALVTQFYCLKHPFHIYIYIYVYICKGCIQEVSLVPTKIHKKTKAG